MFSRYLAAAVILGCLGALAWIGQPSQYAQAQNVQCPDRAKGDSSNACANTRFVGNALPVGANPTATVGSSAVNGVASTFMRSDAAPPLASVASPRMLANVSGGSAAPSATTATSFFDTAFCNTVGYIITRISGSWVCSKAMALPVTWLGAACNDSTDDLTAIQAALDALPAAGGTILIPDSICRVSARLNLDFNVAVIGQGFASGLKTTSQTADILYLDNFGPIYIANLTFSSSVTRTGGAYININQAGGGDGTLLSNLRLVEGYNGIRANGSLMTIRDVFIKNIINIGVLVVTGELLNLENVIVTNASHLGVGMQIAQTGNINIINSQFVGLFYCVELIPASASTISVSGVKVYHDNCSVGLYAHPGNSSGVYRYTCTSCEYTSSQSDGILLDPSGTGVINGFSLNNPVIAGNGRHGLYAVDAAVSNIQITGGYVAQNTNNGIFISGAIQGVQLVGVTVGPWGGWTANATGLVIDTAGSNYIMSIGSSYCNNTNPNTNSSAGANNVLLATANNCL